MSYLVLARKWRPQTFEAVMGQEHITQVLTNAIKSARLAHAFLFSGPRGVGKTSTARILAKALNCDSGPTPTPCNECSLCKEITSGSSPSIIEIDGASNNSVDDIRALREKVGMIPTTGRYKIYIIDEVHMLSQAAFNALLKTLEEPPSHVKFIFATTEIHKIPATILSRCQRFDFRRISSKRIVENIQQIIDKEGISTSGRVLSLIARAADGSMRDALSILDQVLSSSDTGITESEVETLLGLVGTEKLQAMAEAILQGDAAATLNQLEAVLSMGGTLEIYWRQLMEYFRDGLMLRIAVAGVDLSDEEKVLIEKVFQEIKQEDLIRILKIMAEGFDNIRSSQQPRVMAEMILLRLCDRRSYVGLEEIVGKLQSMAGSLSEQSVSMEHNAPPPIPARTDKVVQAAQPAPEPAPCEDIPPEPEQTLKSTEGSVDTKALYQKLIQRVGLVKKPLAAHLPNGMIVGINKEKVVLGFPKGFEKMVNKQESIRILQEEFENILNRPVRVEISKDNLKQSKVSKGEQSALNKEEREMVESNPIVKTITEMFDAKLDSIQKVVS